MAPASPSASTSLPWSICSSSSELATDLFQRHGIQAIAQISGIRLHPFPLHPTRCVTNPPTAPDKLIVVYHQRLHRQVHPLQGRPKGAMLLAPGEVAAQQLHRPPELLIQEQLGCGRGLPHCG